MYLLPQMREGSILQMSELVELSVEQITSIRDNGFCYVQVSPMCFQKMTHKDIVIKREDYDVLVQTMKDNGEWDYENDRPIIKP